MSEKEFLVSFVEYLQERYYSVSANNATMQNIEAFLDKHHETYFEVKFIKKDSPEGDSIELMNAIQEFKTELDKIK